jgi:restriction system protein
LNEWLSDRRISQGLQSFFKPLLDLATDGKEHSIQEARSVIAKQMALPEADMKELLPSGVQTKFDNRIAWAKSYFIQAKILEASRRSHFKITQRGMDLHKKGFSRIDIMILNDYPEFIEFHKSKGAKGEETISTIESSAETPEETLQQAHESIRSNLAGQILEKVILNSPAFFERLVVDLMLAMGYGGSRADAGQSIGGTGDEGIDGIIKEDRLGLDVVYLQAKRWEKKVCG